MGRPKLQNISYDLLKPSIRWTPPNYTDIERVYMAQEIFAAQIDANTTFDSTTPLPTESIGVAITWAIDNSNAAYNLNSANIIDIFDDINLHGNTPAEVAKFLFVSGKYYTARLNTSPNAIDELELELP